MEFEREQSSETNVDIRHLAVSVRPSPLLTLLSTPTQTVVCGERPLLDPDSSIQGAILQVQFSNTSPIRNEVLAKHAMGSRLSS